MKTRIATIALARKSTMTRKPFCLLAGATSALLLVASAHGAPIQAPLTSTTQILAPNAADFGRLDAAVNFIYPASQSGVAAPGSVNGIDFQDIDWLGGTQALTQGGNITITGPGGNRSRFQSTAATITGPDEGVLESIANTINFLGSGESVTFDLTGLVPNNHTRIQIIGGDEGFGSGNWFGDFDVSVNGDSALWDLVADDNFTTASVLTAFGTTDGAGNLQIVVDQITSSGQFAGIGGLIVTSVIPEPTSLALASLGVLGLAFSRRRRNGRGDRA